MGFGLGLTLVLAILVAGAVLAQSLNQFAAGDLISAAQINENFTTLNTEVGRRAPVGTIVAWHKSLAGTPGLPDGWVECNGQTLVDAASPYNGQALPDLNGENRFLRGSGASGVFQDGQLQSHKHLNNDHGHGLNMQAGDGAWGCCFKWYMFSTLGPNAPSDPQGGTSTQNASVAMGDAVDLNSNQAIGGAETRPTNMSVVWIIRVR